ICFFVSGIFGSLLGTLETRLIKNRPQSSIKPKVLFSSIISVGIGIVLTVIGSMVAGSYAKETTLNYAGFGTLLVGIAVLSLGMSGTAVTILKSNWGLK